MKKNDASDSRRVLHRLVKDSICLLGTAFAEDGSTISPAQGFFGELIGLVYRFVCLAVAESKTSTVFHNQSMEQGFYLDRICKLSKTDSEPIWKKICTDMETLCSQMGLNLSKRWWSASLFSRLLQSECDNETIGRVAQEILKTVRNNPLVVQDLGWVYEDLLSHRSQITNGVFTISKSKMSQQKQTGAHYTPNDFVHSVLNETLERFLEDSSNSGAHRTQRVGVTVCDPSCGSGMFLLESARRISNHFFLTHFEGQLSVESGLERIVSSCLYGVDINPISVDVCILSLWLVAGMTKDSLDALDSHIQYGNSLFDSDRLGELNLSSSQLHRFQQMNLFSWKERFPEVFSGERPGFDLVVGNPPWLSFSGRHAHPLPSPHRSLYEVLYEGFSGWLTLHSIFVELGLRLTKNRGFLGFVLPRQLADLSGYAKTRDVIRRYSNVQEPLMYFGEGGFLGVEQPCFALIVQKGGKGRTGGDSFVLESKEPFQDLTQHFLRRLIACGKPPKEMFKDIGVHTGNCSKLLIHKEKSEGYLPVLEGKNIVPFHVLPPNRWLNTEYSKKEGEYFTLRSFTEYERVRIVLRQTASRPIAAVHAPKYYFRNSVLACFGSNQWSDEETVAWLNSTAVAFFYINSIPDSRQNSFPQVKISHLRSLPIPAPSFLFNPETKPTERSQEEQQAWCDQEISRAFGFTIQEHQMLCLLFAYQCLSQQKTHLHRLKKTAKNSTKIENLRRRMNQIHSDIENWRVALESDGE